MQSAQKHVMKAEGVKKVRIKAHHAKPYRKRHYVILATAIVAAVVLLASLISYRDALMQGVGSSRQFISSLFTISSGASTTLTVESTHGVSLGFDQAAFYGSAVDGNGALYVGDELATAQAYTIVRIAPSTTTDIASVPSATFTATVHPAFQTDDAAGQALKDAGLDQAKLALVTADIVKFGDHEYARSVYETTETLLTQELKPQYTVYTTTNEGMLLTVVIAHGVISASADTRFDAILNSISFGTTTAAAVELETFGAVSSSPLASSAALRLLDLATNTQVAAAATATGDVSASERIGALYSPASVKVYNVYCMDITIDNLIATEDYCQGGTGSGFIVNAEGYVGTNGHVATADPVDAIISDAFTSYYNDGEGALLAYLLDKTKLTDADFAGKTSQEALKVMVDAFYDTLDSSTVKATNSVQNLLVSVTSTPPDTAELIKDTQARKKYTGDDNVVVAELIDSNYRQYDGTYTGAYEASDVALIKMKSGGDYPTVVLGSIDDIEQGSNISILGYPAQASDNSIVGNETANATLTTGKVSSVKNATGSDGKLIETDTTIGHGNSGGPALNDAGLVVGIATYTSDGSGIGNGTYNYIRDIADFKALLEDNGIKATPSDTQVAWQAGMDKYYSSHYKSALKYFETVADLYPNHTKVDKFIASAQTHIDNGDDVSEFPLWIVWMSLGAVVLIMGGVIIVIARHNRHHATYKAGVAQGVIQPMQPGVRAPHQEVVVAPGQPVVQPMAQYQQQQPPAGPVVPPRPVVGANDQQPPIQ